MLRKLTSIYKEINSILSQDVIIYSMGKVGSNSLSYSIEEVGLSTGSKHYFGGDKANFFKSISENKFSSTIKKIVRSKINNHKEELKIITLVRDPIARNLSLNFHLLEYILYQTLHGNKDNRKGRYLGLNEIIDIGFEENINTIGPLEWFDKEFKAVTRINIYAHPFDQEKGYTIVQKDKLKVLVLQLEKMPQNENVIRQFLGLDHFELLNSNAGNRAWYADIYQNYKQQYSPSMAYLNEMYSSRYMKHFYTPNEIDKFKDHWASK